MTDKQTKPDDIAEAIKHLGPEDLEVVSDAVRALRKAPIDQHRFVMDFWGMRVDQDASGNWIGRMPITPQVLNPLRIVHGGVTFALADTVMGYAVWHQYEGKRASVSVEIKMTYLAPGRGQELIAEPTVLRAGSTLAYTECKVRDDRGRLVATATGTYYVWDPAQTLPD